MSSARHVGSMYVGSFSLKYCCAASSTLVEKFQNVNTRTFHQDFYM